LQLSKVPLMTEQVGEIQNIGLGQIRVVSI
jgi:hypothetical protein